MTKLKKSDQTKKRKEKKGCQGLWVIKKNCDKTRKLKLWEEKKPKNSNGDKTQKLKLWQNSKTQIMTKLKNWNWDQTQEF